MIQSIVVISGRDIKSCIQQGPITMTIIDIEAIKTKKMDDIKEKRKIKDLYLLILISKMQLEKMDMQLLRKMVLMEKFRRENKNYQFFYI